MHLKRKDISLLSDEALMQLLSTRRSNEALTELHARYANKVLGFFIRMFRGDAEKAQDFVQDLFLRILEKHHLFDPSRKFYTWMFSIASNMCKTSFRAAPHIRIPDDGYESGEQLSWPDNPIDRSVFRKTLRTAIENLEDHHRLTFILRYMQEMNIKDIAQITETSEGTVKSRLFYATKKISKELKEFDPAQEGPIFKIT